MMADNPEFDEGSNIAGIEEKLDRISGKARCSRQSNRHPRAAGTSVAPIRAVPCLGRGVRGRDVDAQ